MLPRVRGAESKTCHCRQMPGRPGDTAHRARSYWWRGGEIAGWIIPSATLILLPKCPVCLAAYIALFSGLGMTVATASGLRTTLQTACITALIYLVVKHLCRLVSKSRGSNPGTPITRNELMVSNQ